MSDGPNPNAKWSKYKDVVEAGFDENGKLKEREFCKTCGEGVFLAVHKDRKSCGKCGFTVSLD